MNDILNILNFIKWQALARMPHGSITQRVSHGINYREKLSVDDPFYYIYWLDIKKSALVKYFLGTYGTTNRDYREFIEFLNRNYKSGDFYEIHGFAYTYKVPIPKEKDYKCFKAEFLDIIMPELAKYIALSQPFLEGPYEYGNVRIKEDTNVLDIGANYGLFSSLASGKRAQVYAFEPTPSVLDEYLRPLAKFDENIHVIERAVTDKTGKAFLNVSDDRPSCNSVVGPNNPSDNMMVVNTTSIDDFMEFTHLSSLDFIKADIEGSERLMLQGAKETLKEFEPDLAICAYHKFDDPKVLSELILDANPNYEITKAYKKIYARSRKKKW